VSSVALPARRRFELGRRSRVWLVVLACAGSAAVFVLLRLRADYPFPTFEGACERLRASGLPLTSRDWFCRPIPWTLRASFAAGSALVGAGFAAAAAILAAAGRRWSALLPLAPALAATHAGVLYADATHWWADAAWPPGAVAGGALTVSLLALPAVAVALLLRPPRAARRGIQPTAAGLAAIALAAPVVPLGWAVARLYERHYAIVGLRWPELGGLAWEAVAVALFAAALGTDRRWWPWALVPVALLVSMAPSTAMVVAPDRLIDWSPFGSVLPLVLVALLASAWVPLAERIARRSAVPDDEDFVEVASAGSPGPAPPIRPRRGQLRPATVANAVAVGLIAVSVIAFAGDPLPAQIATALPTYVGVRTAADDVRARMNLDLATRAIDSYRIERGSFAGFDAAAAAAREPELRWLDGRNADAPELAIQVVASGPNAVRVATISASGSVYCLRRSTDGTTYGSATRRAGRPTGALLRAALASCGSTPWTAAVLRPPPVASMCDEVDDSSYLICRMVQVLESETLARPSA
jgi:hypothetical protein